MDAVHLPQRHSSSRTRRPAWSTRALALAPGLGALVSAGELARSALAEGASLLSWSAVMRPEPQAVAGVALAVLGAMLVRGALSTEPPTDT
jgi:hypothetical protein